MFERGGRRSTRGCLPAFRTCEYEICGGLFETSAIICEVLADCHFLLLLMWTLGGTPVKASSQPSSPVLHGPEDVVGHFHILSPMTSDRNGNGESGCAYHGITDFVTNTLMKVQHVAHFDHHTHLRVAQGPDGSSLTCVSALS